LNKKLCDVSIKYSGIISYKKKWNDALVIKRYFWRWDEDDGDNRHMEIL